MEIHQLRYFVAVVEEGNFSRAAERMHVAQPSLSQQIQKLEAEIGQPLFDRLARRVTVTEAGYGLLPFARKILNELVQAQRFVNDCQSGPAGAITVGIIPTIAPYVMEQIFSAVTTRHPELTVNVLEDVTENLVRASENGSIDVAIVSTCRHRTGIHLESCVKDRLLLALPERHRLAQRRQINWDQLKNESILMLHESHCLSQQIRRWCAENGLRTNTPAHALQLSTILAMVATGLGVALVPSIAIPHERARGCTFKSLTRPTPDREINLLRNPARYQTKAAAAFCEVAREVLGQIAGSNDR